MLFTDKAAPQIAEQKAYIAPMPLESFADYLYGGGHYSLSALAAIQMYKDCTPLFTAIDMRATQFADIPTRLWDKKAEAFIDDHPALDLLEQPNGDTTGREFKYALATYLDITGNSFLYAGGRVENPPLELVTIGPQYFSFPSSGSRFGVLNVPNSIQYSSINSESEIFRAEEDLNTNLIRFITRDPLRDSEIWQIRNFNPLRSGNNFWGMSKGQPAWIEVQQYLSGNRTNWAILKQGTRVSMAWVNNRGEELTDKQWGRMREEADKYSGDLASGRTPILDGMDVKSIQNSFKDMQFQELQEAMIQRIANLYGIPLPLFLAQSMTLNNLETSMLQLFDRAILPLTTYLYSELDRFLLPRYEDTENLTFAFSEHDIPALITRIIENTKKKGEIQVNTIDELRVDLGDKPLAEGGDVVLRPANEIPVGMGDLGDEDLL